MAKTLFYREFIEEANPEFAAQWPYMRDCLSDTPIEHRDEIVDFLSHAGIATIVRMGAPRDIFTNERIAGEAEIRSDGVYEWDASWAHYVDRYNLQLPQDFVDHILRVANEIDQKTER